MLSENNSKDVFWAVSLLVRLVISEESFTQFSGVVAEDEETGDVSRRWLSLMI